MKTPSNTKLQILSILAASAITATNLFAGKGSMDLGNKTVDLHLYLTEKNSAQALQYSTTDPNTISYWFNEASKKLWNATEGHLRIGTLYIYNKTQVGREDMDLSFVTGPEYAWAYVNGLGVSGLRMEFGMSYDGSQFRIPSRFIQSSLVHEFGHYGFGLWDEYLGHIRRVSLGRNPSTGQQTVNVDPNYVLNPEPSRAAIYWGWNGGGDSWMTAGRIFYSAWSLNDTSWTDPKWTSSIMDLDFATNCTEFSWDGDYPYNLTSSDPSVPRGNLKELPRGITNTRGRMLLPPGSWWVTTMQEERNRESCWATVAKKLGIPKPTSPPSTEMPPGFVNVNCVVVDDRVSMMLCIDQSGSMSGYRLEQAKEGAKLFTNIAKTGGDGDVGDYLGMSAFSTSASVPTPIRELTSASSKEDILSAIDSLVATGATSIGSGLEVSRQQIESVSPSAPLAGETIILLSDGQQNVSPWAEDILPAVKERGIKVFTISLGSGADLALMQQIADETNGRHFVVGNSSDLQAAYAEIAQLAREVDGLSTLAGNLLAGGQLSQQIAINQGNQEAIFVLASDSPGLSLDLRAPNGEIINSTSSSGVESIVSGNSRIVSIRNPLAGNWTASVRASSPTNPLAFVSSEKTPATITDGRSTLKRTLQVSIEDVITSLFPSVAIRHPFVGDLKISLQAPDKTTVVLHNLSGTGQDLRGTFGRNLASSEDLSRFNGKPMKGTWTLIVEDKASGDVGALESWGLTLNDEGNPAPSTPKFELSAGAKNDKISVVSGVGKAIVAYPEMTVLRTTLNSNGPISRANVVAVITHPDGETQSLVHLYDNGLPGNADETPGDGTYSGYFSGYSANGVYEAVIDIDSSNAIIDITGNTYNENIATVMPAPKFKREESLQFTVSGVPNTATNAVQVKSLAILKDASNSGNLNLSGAINAEDWQYDPKKDPFQFSLDGYQISLNPSDFKQKGRIYEYLVKPSRENNRSLTVRITPYVGGTSKSLYTIFAKSENLQNVSVSEANPELDFNLTAGAINDGARLLTTTKAGSKGISSSYRAGNNGEQDPALYVQSAAVKIDPKRANRDSFQLLAELPGWPLSGDLANQTASLTLGGIQYNFPAGSLKLQANGTYQATQDGKNITLRISPEKKTLQLVSKNRQLGSVANPANLTVDIGGQTQTARLFLFQNPKNGTYVY